MHARLRGTPCRVKMSDMRLRIAAAGAVFYPDLLVHCKPVPLSASTTELTAARLVIEVLSPSTQHFDRGAKLLAYQKLQGLRQIVLLSSTEEAAWTCARDDDGAWSPLEAWDRGTGLAVPSLGLALTWDKVYGGVGLG